MRNNLASDVFTLRIVFFPKDSFASNLYTVTYPCLVLCLTPVLVFRYRSTNSHTVICPYALSRSEDSSFGIPSCLSSSAFAISLASSALDGAADISQMQHEESACVLRSMPRNPLHPYFSINHRIFFGSERNSRLPKKDSKYPFLLNVVLP